MVQKPTRSKRILRHLGKVSVAVLTASLMISPVFAVDPVEVAGEVLGNEGGKLAAKETLNSALKLARSKPALSAATTIVCISCLPVGAAAASPAMCIACGILFTKTFGQFIAKFSFNLEDLIGDYISFNLEGLIIAYLSILPPMF